MRKGLLASLALLLGHTSAQAQHWPAQTPYYPAPNYAPVWVAPPGPGYYPNNGQRPAYPVASPNYLPQSYFPGQFARPMAMPMQVPLMVQESSATPAPPEPEPTTIIVEVPAQTVARPVTLAGPGAYFETVPAHGGSYAEAPKDSVRYHRECKERGWIGGEYLLGWITQGPLHVPIVTTGSPFDEAPAALNQPGTIVVFGNNNLDFRLFHGIRGEVGRFVDDCNRISVAASAFYLLPRHTRFAIQSDGAGNPVIGRPVFNVVNGEEDVYAVSYPDVDPDFPTLVTGGTTVDARSQLMGGEVNGRWHSYCGRRLQTQIMAGFRTVRLDEEISIRDQFTIQTDDSGFNFKDLSLFAGDTVVNLDAFRASNQFFGFQLGGALRWELQRAQLDLFTKVALGITDQRVRIDGSSSLSSFFSGDQTSPGGIFALPSNMGEHNRQVFGVVPEVGVNFAADVSKNLRVKAGYSCLFWSGVVRPGSHIDRNINSSQVPTDQNFAGADTGPARPEFNFRETGFFLQTFNFGFEFHY